MRSHALASAAAALCLLAAPAAFARSPEAQAVSVFHATCVVGQGQSAAIDKTLAPLVAKQLASAVPMADFTKRTGLKADYAWVVMPGKGTQKLLVTTEPGLCAVHVAEGDGARLKKDFTAAAQLLAQASKGTLETQKDAAGTLTYGVALPGAKTEPVLSLETHDKQASSGTKHLMTFSVIKK